MRLALHIFFIIALLMMCNACFPAASRKNSVSPKLLQTKVISTTQASPVNALESSVEESRFIQYAKSKSSGFFIEVETSLDESVRVHQLQRLPKAYSQLLSNDVKTRVISKHDEELPLNDEGTNIQEITDPEKLPVEGEEESNLTPEDMLVQKDWGEGCFSKHWNHCNKIKEIVVYNVYNKTAGKDLIPISLEMDCLAQKVLCLTNGWTANRCHLLCMSHCNKNILQQWDQMVNYETPCKYM